MKIVAFSDIHGMKRKAKKVVEKFFDSNASLTILAGDISILNNEKSYFNVLEPFFEEKVELILIPGNHDTSETLNFVIERLKEQYNFDKVRNVEKKVFQKNGFYFLAFSANNMGPTNEIYTEEESKEILEKLIKKVKNKEKLITISHTHPSGFLEELLFFPGSIAWKEFIEKYKPILHLHGHIHEMEGKEYYIGRTKVFNLGPNPYVFDLKALLNQKKTSEKTKSKTDGRG